MNRAQLHQLIHKLSKSEKRYFKMYVTKYKPEKSNKSVQLFDLLNKMAEYDEDKLLESYSKSELTYDLHKLKTLLLNALSDLNFTQDPDKPGEIINRIALGFKYKEANIIENHLKKGYDLSEQTKDPGFHLHLLQYESTLRRSEQHIDDLIKVDKKIRNQTEVWNQTTSYHQMWLEVLKWYHKNVDKKEPKPLSFSEPYLSKLFNKSPNGENFEGKANYLKAKSLYFGLLKEFETSLKINDELLNNYLGSSEHPDVFLPILYNVVIYSLKLGNIEKAEEVLEKADLLNYPIGDKYVLESFYLMILTFFLLEKETYKEVVDMEPRIEFFYQEEQKKIIKKENQVYQQWIFCFIVALFKEQHYSKCLDWILKSRKLNNHSKKEQPTKFTILQFIELFSHLELNHKKLLPSLVQSIQYTLNKKKNSHLLQETELIRFAKFLIRGEPNKLNKQLFDKTEMLDYYKIFFPYLAKKEQSLNL